MPNSKKNGRKKPSAKVKDLRATKNPKGGAHIKFVSRTSKVDTTG